ncbi:hypothetical protein TD95_002642 [Thielaviopsis punctulata]|uniref:Uncharacterized protein n=1 Tax=Thielaviopsis punctulata TaxID=72032 RepID=A0A0F4Z962_9PEZI|nr:hypothetical protein TD95_002642 [Thielaviopsis punctulata]
MGTRRLPLLLSAVLIFILFSIFVAVPTSPSTLSSVAPAAADGSKASSDAHKFSLPSVPSSFHDVTNALNPFRPPAHAPPRQKNDTDGESSWWADWKWLTPFSSSLTLDDDRSLLPPLKARPPIYCYYDTTTKKDAATKDAESALLLTWRRAWWAKGFLPVILGAPEATGNPMYDNLQRLQLEPDVKTQLMRWLAWDTMGGGILAHYTLLPMGRAEDPLLVYLRRGEYPKMSRYSGLDTGLLVGPTADLTKAIKAVLDSPQLATTKDILQAIPGDIFSVDKTPKAVAYYDAAAIESKYNAVSKAITENRAGGLKKLDELINAHLHQTWQNIFSDGLAVLKPVPEHTSFLVTNAVTLANDLASCSPSPLDAGSCPPNLPNCVPCSDKHRMKLTTPESFVNSSTLYTIGTVPHPYTFATMTHLRDSMDVKWLLTNLQLRDPWLAKVTEKLFDEPASRSSMLVKIKEAIAGDFAPAHSLWLSAEKDAPPDLSWHFGFSIPHSTVEALKNAKPPNMPTLLHDSWSSTKAAAMSEDDDDDDIDAKRSLVKKSEAKTKTVVNEEDSHVDFASKEAAILKKALNIKNSKDANDIKIRNAIEAWNIADMEAWKFARAFLARRTVERKQWETEESKYTHGVGSEEGRKTRWWDNLEDKISDKISSVTSPKADEKNGGKEPKKDEKKESGKI